VTSVDGVNVISGDTASPSQSGYVLDPWGSVEIAGWRKGLDHVAAFYFTDLRDSYAARTGRPQNVWRDRRRRFSGAANAHFEIVNGICVGRLGRRITTRGTPCEQRSAERTTRRPDQRRKRPAPVMDVVVRRNSRGRNSGIRRKAMSKLGTGHGRNEESRVSVTNFDRATDRPAETVSLQYDKRENLIAMG
jgi:hypothetical protein